MFWQNDKKRPMWLLQSLLNLMAVLTQKSPQSKNIPGDDSEYASARLEYVLLIRSCLYVFMFHAKAMRSCIDVFAYREEEKESAISAFVPHTRWRLVSLLLRIFVDLSADLSPAELSSKFYSLLKRGDLHHILFDVTLNEKNKVGDLEIPPENDNASTQPDFKCLGMDLAKEAQFLYAQAQRLTLGLLLQVCVCYGVMFENI